MATRKIAPALAAGCTVVIKPAELTPLTTSFFVQLLEEAGLPAGVVNVVPTSNPSAQSQRLLSDPRLRKLSFTGSTEVGKMLLAAAAPNVLRTSMELGGNAPFVVFEDADLDRAVEGVLLAKFRKPSPRPSASSEMRSTPVRSSSRAARRSRGWATSSSRPCSTTSVRSPQ